MKQLLAVIVIVCVMVFSGCYDQREAESFNKASFASPQYVGEINGQRLYRIEIARAGYDERMNHFVYFFDTNSVVTLNRREQHGKVALQKVEVFLNGNPILITNVP